MKINSKNKHIVLCFIKHYLPGYKFGGPVRTIANMVDRLGDEFDFKIFTLDCDFTEQQQYPDIKPNEWNQVGKAQVYYCSRNKMTFKFLRRFLSQTKYDVLYFNSYFDPLFTVKLLLLRQLKLLPDIPVILAPRGEFSSGAISIKAYKKNPFIAVVKKTGLYHNIIWHASTEYEAADIKRVMGDVAKNVSIARNLSSNDSDENINEWSAKSQELLRVVFLSRISHKKNLDYALGVMKDVRVNVSFDIYGTPENSEYWNTCLNIIKTLPKNVKVKYCGELPHDKINNVLQNYDLFFFPTRGENYGHVIMEALTAGLPLLISDQTPWRDLEAKRVGWDLPLEDPSVFVRKIEELVAIDAAEHRNMRNRALSFSQEISKDPDVLSANQDLFNRAFNSEHNDF